jgi:hypothetical protein
LDDALTAMSWGCERSLAKLWRALVAHVLAPERQASASGTTWSMSTLDELVRVTPSYSLNQCPMAPSGL